MPGPPQAVEESHNGDAKGKTENYYLTHKFTTRESISAPFIVALTDVAGEGCLASVSTEASLVIQQSDEPITAPHARMICRIMCLEVCVWV